MKEMKINGRNQLCFLVKRGEKKDVVIPIDSLVRVDYKRISEMEAQGGELMRVMRDTTLDNGVNALVMYKDLLVVVDRAAPASQNVAAPATSIPVTVAEANTETPKKRGRGRPPKNPVPSDS